MVLWLKWGEGRGSKIGSESQSVPVRGKRRDWGRNGGYRGQAGLRPACDPPILPVSQCTPYLAMIFVVLSPCTCHGHVMLLLENPTRSTIDTRLASRCPWGGVTFTIQLAKAGTSRTKRKRQISDPRNHPYQTPATRTSTSTSRRCMCLKTGSTYCGSATHFDLLLIC